MTVSVEPDDARGPGHALIRVPNAAAVTDAGFRIARDPDWPEPNLGPAGWQGAETLLTPDAVVRDGNDLVLSVGPAVCERLEVGMFVFALPAAGVSTAVMWPEIAAVHGGSGATFATGPTAPARVTDPVAAMPPVLPPMLPGVTPASPATPVTPAVPPPPTPGAARSPRPLLAALLVVLAAASGGAWWWLHRTPALPTEPQQAAVVPPAPVLPTPAPTPPPAPSPAPAPPPVDLDAMPVRDLLARNNTADMLDQARKRLAARPGEALLLLETAGEDRHDGAALTLLAQVYDPNKPRQGGIGADPRQAAKDYREAERSNDHFGAADRDALHRSLIAARDSGDVQARLIEQDFWP